MLPSLSDDRRLRYLAFALLYFAQGLPFGLLTIAVPARLAESGVEAGRIGTFLAISFLPWTLKLIAGPVMDRWTFLAMGRRRPWILFAQAGMVLAMAAMAGIAEPAHELERLTVLAFVLSTFTAIQDVATDGMAVDLLHVDERGHGNALMWGSKTLGTSASAAGSGFLVALGGFPACVGAVAAAMLLLATVPLCLRERPGERLLPFSRGVAAPESALLVPPSWRALWRDLWQAIATPASGQVMVASFVFSVGIALVNAVLPVVAVKQLGWSAEAFSELGASSRFVAGIAVMLAGGFLVRAFGWRRVIVVGGVLLCLSLLPAMLRAPAPDAALVAFVFWFKIIGTQLIVTYFALKMALCSRHVSAMQFAAYLAVANLGFAAGPALLGPLLTGGVPVVFAFVFACLVLSTGIIWRLRLP